MEECFEDWAGAVGPIAIGFRGEALAGAFRHDFKKPWIKSFALIVFAQHFDDAAGQILQVVDFEALMVEVIEGIFETPVTLGLLQQLRSSATAEAARSVGRYPNRISHS